MPLRIIDLTSDNGELIDQAARLLLDAFRNRTEEWQDLESARQEVVASFAEDRINRALVDDSGIALGWIGGTPTYGGRVWEIHPLVVSGSHRRRGIGRALVEDLERLVTRRGALTLWASSDDENGETTLSGKDLYPDIPGAIQSIRNLRQHPYEFYLRLGFRIAGVLPDANGRGKPDIFLAKRVSIPEWKGGARKNGQEKQGWQDDRSEEASREVAWWKGSRQETQSGSKHHEDVISVKARPRRARLHGPMLNDRKISQYAFLTALVCGATALAISIYAFLTLRQYSAIYLAATSIPYIAISLSGMRGKIRPLPSLIVGVGFVFAAIECTNIVLEEFVGLGAPANAIVPASAMAAMILAAAVSAVVVSSSKGIRDGIAAAVFAVGIGAVVSCAVGLVLIAVAHGSDLSRGVTNATTHLILPLIVAAAVGALAAFSVNVSPARIRIALSLAGSLFLFAGIHLLVKAASLPRSERPALVMPGMLFAALGLTLLPSLLARVGSRSAPTP